MIEPHDWLHWDCAVHRLVQEKEKLYVELKGILARQPGPEVAEQLSIYQVCCWLRAAGARVTGVRP